MDHGDDFIVMLHSKQHILKASKYLPIGSLLELLHLFLELMILILWPALQQHIDTGHKNKVGEAEANKIDEIALVVVDTALGNF